MFQQLHTGGSVTAESRDVMYSTSAIEPHYHKQPTDERELEKHRQNKNEHQQQQQRLQLQKYQKQSKIQENTLDGKHLIKVQTHAGHSICDPVTLTFDLST